MNAPIQLQQMAEMLRPRPADAHKGIMGHALFVAGSHGIAGCAVLGAEACLRSGVGKLTVHTAPANRQILQTAVPEAIVAFTGQESDRHIRQAITPATPFQAIGMGPGIGREAAEALHQYISQSGAPLVLDADALHILSEHPRWATALGERTILTPHMGEMKALQQGFSLSGTPLQVAVQLASDYHLTVVLKGHPTHICLPDGTVQECCRGNAGMATAGSGDVLTGIITGLLAQGYSATEAATLGVWLHASAGDAAAEELGQECLLARDIIRHLPDAFRELRGRRRH